MKLYASSLGRFALRALFAVCVAALLLASLAHAQTESSTESRITLATRTAQSFSTAQDVGPLPDSQRISLTLTLAAPSDRAAALDSFLAALTTSSSPSYHRWLTPAQFGAAFGATPDQLSAATTWASAQGLSVDGVSPSGLRLTISGTSAQLAATFATPLHSYTVAGKSTYYANTTEPTLPADTAALFTSVEGLDNLPAPAIALAPGRGTALDAAALATLVDANTTPLLALTSSTCTADLSASQLAAYTAVFRQAAAQGMTTLSTRACATGAFPAALAEVTAVALPTDGADTATPSEARPGWQSAPGLPADALRHAPDITVSSVADLVQTLTTIAAGSRLGNVNPVLYELGPTPGLYTQPDGAAAGTWEPATGLGLVDLPQLGKVYPRGTGMSYTSFQATNYSPIHGQGTSFTSTVTSGTGGPTPTGTVAFTTSTGTVLGTATLVNGTGSITVTTLEGGNYTIDAAYSGDGTYAPSTSPSGQLFVQPEPSALSVAITGNPTVGSTYNVTVTDTASSGVGVPSGPVSVTISGTSSIYTAALAPEGASSASATVTIPATTAGTLTLSVQCTTSADFSCYNPYTTTVTIAKATPTLSISYSPNPPVSGASIALNAVVSTVGTAPAPTGAVTFYDNGTTLNAGQLNNGSTSATGTVPQGASNTITATYAGDANYNSVSTTAGSTSSGTIKTTLALASSTNTVTAGASITFTATLAATSTGPAAASGTVTFFDGAAQIGTSNLYNGTTATFTTTTLSATANHTITAIYSGDGNYSTSTSNAVGLGFSNTTSTATVTLAVSPTNPVHGQRTTFVATVSSANGGTLPTGTVTFSNTVTGLIGTGTLTNGVASFSTTALTGGAYHYTATYSGDATYTTATSAPYPLTVTVEPVDLTINVPANATFGTPFIVTVNVTGTSGVGSPTGTVTVQPQGTGYAASSSAGVVSPQPNGFGTASVTVQATGAGPISFTATYTGDTNFAPAGPTSLTATVSKVTSTTSLAFNPTQPVTGQPTTLTAKVAFVGAIAPTGTAQFFDGSTSLGTANLDATGTATLSTTFSAGNHTVSAVYSGDANYMASTSVPQNTTTGTTASTTTLTPSSTTGTVMSPLTLTVAVGPTANGAVPTGTVQIFAAGSAVCTITLVNGQGSCLYAPAVAGMTTLTANYLGDSMFAASSSAPVVITASAAGGSLVASLSASTVASGAADTVNVTVTSPGATVPTGSIVVNILNRGGIVVATSSTQIANTTSNVSSFVIPITAPTVADSYSVVVSCTATFFTCTPVSLPLTVSGSVSTNRIATTTAVAAAATTTANVVTLTATVTAASTGTALPTGTVTFYDGTTQIGTGTLTTGGTASTTVTLSATTTHSITAVYSGDTLYAGSSSTAITGVTGTTPASSAVITLTANTTTALAGSPVVLTASVSGVSGTTTVPTGTVSFYAAGTSPVLLGTATLGTAGSGLAIATLTTNAIPAGTGSVYAVYNGDANFKAATSNSVSFGLGSYSVSFTPAALTVAAGQSGQSTLTVAVSNGFAGTIALGCNPPANAQITCSVSPLILNGVGTATLTVNTVAPHARTSQQASLGVLGCVSCTALLCWLLPAGKRRRVPAMLLVLLALALASNLGCSENNFPGQAQLSGGTPLGTYVVTVNTLATVGSTTVRQNYQVQVTVQ